MIAWPIKAALESGCFERVVVSTDDEEIAEVAKGSGAEVPFLRSADLSDDHAPTVPVIGDAITRMSVDGRTAVCCLYATSPFVMPADLQAGLEALSETGASYVISVTTYAFPIQRALTRDRIGEVKMIDPSNMMTRSQNLEEAWHDAGQFYWGKAETWLSGRGLFEPGAHGLVLPRHRVQDIDTEEDWQRAEWMMTALQNEMQNRS